MKSAPWTKMRVEGLSEGKRRALALADNKIAENAGWDRELLATELPELADILIVEGLDISIIGFAPVEIDQITTDFEEDSSDPADTVDPEWTKAPPLSTRDDLWQLGHHRLLCGDARNAEGLARLMGESSAAMAFLDPPYNVRVRDIVGRGQIKHSEFAMASGELPRAGGCCGVRRRCHPFRLHGLAPSRRTARGWRRSVPRDVEFGGLGKDQRWSGLVLSQRS
jgi:hypothetical protein